MVGERVVGPLGLQLARDIAGQRQGCSMRSRSDADASDAQCVQFSDRRHTFRRQNVDRPNSLHKRPDDVGVLGVGNEHAIGPSREESLTALNRRREPAFWRADLPQKHVGAGVDDDLHAGGLRRFRNRRYLIALQRQLLEAGAAALKPGGTLVYSTCTISPTENERVVAAFLAAHENFFATDLGVDVPPWKHPTMPQHLQTFPHRDRTDGFFVARLRRA